MPALFALLALAALLLPAPWSGVAVGLAAVLALALSRSFAPRIGGRRQREALVLVWAVVALLGVVVTVQRSAPRSAMVGLLGLLSVAIVWRARGGG